MSTKTYVIKRKWYSLGVLHDEGSTVTVPADFTPARDWVEVKPTEPQEAAPANKKSRGRASDEDVA